MPIIGIVFFLLIVLAVVIIYMVRKRKAQTRAHKRIYEPFSDRQATNDIPPIPPIPPIPAVYTQLPLAADTRLQGGRYTILRTLGQGGFGITYLGIQAGLNRQVAIKEFFMKEHCERNSQNSHVRAGTQGSQATVERFKAKFIKEAQTLSALNDPHIIRIYDIFEENGTAYYVMEYIDGGSLKDLTARQGSLPEAEALFYVRQLAEALDYIHSQKVLHLDLKPANVLIRMPKREAVLIDFGIAKRYDEEGEQTSSTPVGISKGYAPLEQYQQGGVSNFSPATDIYSLGATLYFLLTATTPPEASRLYEEGLPALPAFVSPSLRHAVEKAMQPRRKDRPQSAEQFIRLLNGKADDIKHEETQA